MPWLDWAAGADCCEKWPCVGALLLANGCFQTSTGLCYTCPIMLFIHHPTSAALAPVFTHREDRGAWPWRQPA